MLRIRNAALTFLAVIAWSCADFTAPVDPADPWGLEGVAPSMSVLEELPAVCGTPTRVDLIADENTPVGTVEVVQDGQNLYVVYRTDESWPIGKTALTIGETVEDIPTTSTGNPRIGVFPYTSSHADVHEVIWPVPLASLDGGSVVLAAFAELGGEAAGAWGEGEPLAAQGNWAMYFTHEVDGCAAGLVGPDGGTLRVPDGGASLEIGAGALLEPVAITMQPVDIDEIQAYIDARDGAGGAPAAGPASTPSAAPLDDFALLYNLVPIPGTTWDLGPDGLEFEEPVTLALGYDEASLPDGVDESELGVFVINGVIPYAAVPSVVDTENNIVYATVEHFSFFFVAYELATPVDLAVADLRLASHSEARVGARMDFFSTVRNLGPEGSAGGTLLYQAFGDVVLGGVFGACDEIDDPIFGAVAVRCPVGPLEPGEADPMPSLLLIPQSEGEVTVWATVRPASGDMDVNGDNDRAVLTLTIGPAVQTDVAVTGLFEPSEPARVGETLEYGGNVTNFGPDVAEGAVFTWVAFGDVTLDGVYGLCEEIDDLIFGTVGVRCPVDPALAADATRGVPVLRITPQSEAPITVWATINPGPGAVDPNEENNRLTATPEFEVITTDVAVTGLFEPSEPARVGETLEYGGNVTNFGPDVAEGAVFTWVAFGDVTLDGVFGLCEEITDLIFGTVGVRCPVDPALAADATRGVPVLRITPQSEAPITVWATINPGPGAVDPNEENNRLTATPEFETLDLVADVTVDFIRQLQGAVAGEPVEFASRALNLGPDEVPEGTVFTWVAFGDVELGAVPAGCEAVASPPVGDVSIECTLFIIGVESFRSAPDFQIVPQSLDGIAIWGTATPPSGVQDPDPSNNRFVLEGLIEASGSE
jgi:hypothetical protein